MVTQAVEIMPSAWLRHESSVSKSTEVVEVMVAEEFELSRVALVALLRRSERIDVIGAAGDSDDAVKLASRLRPSVVVVGSESGQTSAVGVAEKLAEIPGCRTILLGMRFDRAVVRRAFAGPIAGLVQKDVPTRQLFDAIYQVYRGQRVFDPDMTVAAMQNGDCPLSPREITVLECAALGDTVAEIAACCNLSEGTVRNYLSSTVAKLGARNRIDAVRVALEASWICAQ
ncbi:response regulator transcription factor [Nocardia sp. NPDC051321]|uniref:response regulator transcription factor n=1 Tax=Nocardia sp. NPDC051321 TaxID=3364323 RepID=UPI0037A7180F